MLELALPQPSIAQSHPQAQPSARTVFATVPGAVEPIAWWAWAPAACDTGVSWCIPA